MNKLQFYGLILFFFSYVAFAQSEKNRYFKEYQDIATYFKSLTKNSTWKLLDSIQLKFKTYHPQGMLKIGDYFYLSSVETIKPTEKYKYSIDGYDRSTGSGKGYLFKFNKKGKLISKVNIGEGTIFHPGGIDFDGQKIWVSVAEYRPNSTSIIYKISPDNLRVTEVFRFKDHIGDLTFNTKDKTLHGLNWGSKRMYTWKLPKNNKTLNPKPSKLYLKSSYYIDYQDCHYLPKHFMLCGGISKYKIPDLDEIAFGGLELIDLYSYSTIHQIPVSIWVRPDLVMTHNPFFFKMNDKNQLDFYFVPEDNQSTLYIYQVSN